MYTLKLNTSTWDLSLDGSGHIATTDGAYAVAQAVANRVRLFEGDSIYEPDRGIPHFLTSLGEHVSPAVIRSRCNEAALEVEEVEKAETTLDGTSDRILSGDIELTLTDGSELNVVI